MTKIGALIKLQRKEIARLKAQLKYKRDLKGAKQFIEDNFKKGLKWTGFTIELDELYDNIEKLRQRFCGYYPSTHCDCKYGSSGKGEQTSCPELRMVLDLIRNYQAIHNA